MTCSSSSSCPFYCYFSLLILFVGTRRSTGLVSPLSCSFQQQRPPTHLGVINTHPVLTSRRQLISAATTLSFVSVPFITPVKNAQAAPPVSIMMEELGYFPIRTSNNKSSIVYAPARVRRDSSAQAVALAQYMRDNSIAMAGAYWCPHCRRQRELLGRQALTVLTYRECAADGYQAQVCPRGVTGYPSWVQGNKVIAAGEMPIGVLAETIGYPGVIDEALEENVPPPLGSASCRLPNGSADGQ